MTANDGQTHYVGDDCTPAHEAPEIRVLRDLGPADTGSQPIYAPGQARGAIPNGARVRKSRNEPGDTHVIGDQATVISSQGPTSGDFFYFVVWDDLPGVPVGIRGRKLARL